MLIALAFDHFSRELLLKEQMIIPVKKTLKNAGHIDAKLIDFSEICQKKSNKIGCFLLIVYPEISREVGQFFLEFASENPTKFDFSPAKSAYFFFFCEFRLFFPVKIPRNRPIFPRICPWKSHEILLFFREISEAPFFLAKSTEFNWCL